MDVYSAVKFLSELGFQEVVLPFILVFTISYAIFERTMILGTTSSGKSQNNLNAMAAFVLGFTFIAFSAYVAALNIILPSLAIFLLMIFFLNLLLGFFGLHEHKSLKGNWVMGFLFVGIVGIFAVSLGFINKTNWPKILSVFWHPIIWTGVVFVFIIWLIARDGQKKIQAEDSGSSNAKSGPEPSSSGNKGFGADYKDIEDEVNKKGSYAKTL